MGALLRTASLLGTLALALSAVTAAAQGDLDWAAWGIVLAAAVHLGAAASSVTKGPAVGLARAATLIVTALSFGVVPAFVAFEVHMGPETWGQVLAVLYAIAAAFGIVRSRVEPGPRNNPTTQGLPAVAGAVILATIYPFFNAPAVSPIVGGLPNAQEVGGIMICLLILMVSPIPYPVVSRRWILSAPRWSWAAIPVVTLGVLVAPAYLVFPLLSAYTFWGIAESLTPVIAEGILDEDEATEVGKEGRSEDSVEPYRARSTWD